MKIIILLTFLASLMIITAVINGDAATITVNRPTSSDGVYDPLLATAWTNLQSSGSYSTMLNTINRYNNQNDLAKGFANANAFASHAGTLQGYQNYNNFAVSAGLMWGIQAPTTNPDYYNPNNVESDIRDDGDLYAGFSAGAAVNVGIHARFITSGLYITGKFGRIEYGDAQDLFSYKNTIFGLGINYALLMPRGMLVGILKWRGISFGTGVIYQRNEINYEVAMDEIQTSIDGGSTLVIDPTTNFGFDITTYTFPIEFVTSFQLLWIFNITAGAGMDFIMGSSDLEITSSGSIYIQGTPTGTITPGNVVVDGSTRDVSPSHYRPKLMAGIGFSILMVKIDFPVIYYPDAGAAFGVTAAVVF